MPRSPDPRRGPDRRRLPRGGRRATDQAGYAPLVLLVDENAQSGEECEAILVKLRFAVAPARSAEEGVRIMTGLRPDLIVARSADAARLRESAAPHVPVVVMSGEAMDADALIRDIRHALRTKKV
jgi:CheY-like chemotaxis protein